MQTKIITDTQLAADEIVKGNAAALPTETVYGLAANALDEKAVLKIFQTKERPLFNPLIVHVLSVSEIEKYAGEIPDSAYKLIEKYSPGPITFVFNRKEKSKDLIPSIISSGMNSVALRIPSHNLFREVLEISGLPVCAPSANRFGRISPVTANDVLKELDGKIEYILDGGKCSVGIESTVISFLEDMPVILRPGFVTREDISETLGEDIQFQNTGAINSPGMLKDHYAPSKKLFIAKSDLTEADQKELSELLQGIPGYLLLSKYPDLNIAALNLFSELRALDESDCNYIVADKVKEEGLGIAINDRLTKAATGYIKKENGKWRVIPK